MFPKNLEDYDPVFTLAIFSRAEGRELWRCEKDSASLSQLDQFLKKSALFTAKTPDKSLFNGHAPAKVDARRVALDTYLEEILNTQMDTVTALEICRYISTNTMEPNAEEISPNGDSTGESPIHNGPGGRPLKNGYLTKRGKNFGGWKARFFVLDGPIFNYYESPGGPHLGKIKLQKSQIGKQQQSENQSPSRGDVDDTDNQYRHAFLILEPKRKDSSSLVRHVLCAESDKERDQWVEALLQYVDYKGSEDEEDEKHSLARHDSAASSSSNHANGMNAKKKQYAPTRGPIKERDDDLRGVSYETTKQGNIPHGVRSKNSGTPSPPTNGHEREPFPQSQSMKSISAPRNAQHIQDSGSWGNKQGLLMPMAAEDKKQRKRSFFGFGSKPRPSTDSQDVNSNDSNTNLSQMAYEQHGPIRQQFGAPLGEAVKFNHPADVKIELPSVVYRCIEYLDAKNAAGEEGIFRLSGSNVVIKQLRERFNVEGDVNLITDDQYYDIHAVASLLKLYFRELPTTILTRELHLEFVAVTELHDLNEKISALNGLVHRLPTVNNNILRYLAGFLINIINHADINKMTVRNVGIVFSPTLNIPAPVFALFLQQYDGIFGQEPDSHEHTVEVTVAAPPLRSDDLRSPRQQHFQNLPTPSYEQQSFPQQFPPSRGPPPNFPSGPKHAQGHRAGYETGFTPMQPAYESVQMHGIPTIAGPEYGRNTPTLAGPSYEQYHGPIAGQRQFENQASQSKSKRRESSMFGIGMAQKRPSNNNMRSESREST
jgi:RalA-binding protein 1